MLFVLKGYEYYVEQEKGCFMFMDCPGKAASEKRACSMLEYEVKRERKEQ